MSSIMGGMAVFCLIYAALVPDFDLVKYLFLHALKWSGVAAVIVVPSRFVLEFV